MLRIAGRWVYSIAWRAFDEHRKLCGVRIKAISGRQDDMEAVIENVDEQEDYSLNGHRKGRCHSRNSKRGVWPSAISHSNELAETP